MPALQQGCARAAFRRRDHDSRVLQVYKQNDRLVQHMAKQHADELHAAHATHPKVTAPSFAESAPPPPPPRPPPPRFSCWSLHTLHPQAAREAAAALLEKSNPKLQVARNRSSSHASGCHPCFFSPSLRPLLHRTSTHTPRKRRGCCYRSACAALRVTLYFCNIWEHVLPETEAPQVQPPPHPHPPPPPLPFHLSEHSPLLTLGQSSTPHSAVSSGRPHLVPM